MSCGPATGSRIQDDEPCVIGYTLEAASTMDLQLGGVHSTGMGGQIGRSTQTNTPLMPILDLDLTLA
jgi:hypothetical protein